MATDVEEEHQTLNNLLEASKTPSGRAQLADSGTVSSTLSRLSAFPPTSSLSRLSAFPPTSSLILPSLRLLRNLCAGEVSNQDSFIHSSGQDIIFSLIVSSQEPVSPEIIRAGLQVLGNVVLAGEAHRTAVWTRFFPDGMLNLARVRERGICDPLCMLIDTCCSSIGGKVRLDELCGADNGLRILLEIIKTASQVDYQEEWLEWLLFKACVEEEKFSILFLSLNSTHDPNISITNELKSEFFNSLHSFLLGIISKCLTERPKEVTISNKFAIDILSLLKTTWKIVDFSSQNNSPIPTGNPPIDLLGYSLILLRDMCAWEDDKISHESNKERPIDSLLDNGLLDLVLALLDELEPPSIIKKSMKSQPGSSKSVCVYKGYRRDIVSIIANCLHRNKRVQDEIREKNKIPLLLQQCVLDEDNPFLREWGLVAVRNLVEGNEENVKEISELEVKEAVTTPEIAELGLRVEVDKESRKAKLVNISK